MTAIARDARWSVYGCLLFAVLLMSAPRVSIAQGPAGGLWSGQAQCVVVAKGVDYVDEQTHTWTLTGAPPTPAPPGSAQVYYTWPATWKVQGSGRKGFPSRTPGAAAGDQSERWTIASEMNATLRLTEIAGTPARLRIGADGQRGAPLGSIKVTEVSGRTRDGSVQPWTFPTIEDNASSTTITGSSTRTYPEGVGVGWGFPPKAITTATCTWSFTRAVFQQSGAAGRGRGAPIPSPSTTGQPAGARASGTATSTAPGTSTVPGTGGGVVLGQGQSCATPGPDAEPTVTPVSVTFAWRPVATATAYVVSDKNGNPLAPPMTQLTYTHNAPHNPGFSYSYSVMARLANGGCSITQLTFTPPPPLTPQVTVRVVANTQPGRVALTWGDQPDLPNYYLVLGPGIPANGAEITASRSGQSYEIGQLPAGTHRWSVTPYWRAGTDIVGDDALGARATATIAPPIPAPRTISLVGFSGAGTWVTVAPRTIPLTGFTGAGTFVVVAPRTIPLSGWTGVGPEVQGVIR